MTLFSSSCQLSSLLLTQFLREKFYSKLILNLLTGSCRFYVIGHERESICCPNFDMILAKPDLGLKSFCGQCVAMTSET